MFSLKSCEKCGGDVYQERDIYGLSVTCVQCGNYFAGTVERPDNIERFDRFGDEPVLRKRRRKVA